MDSHDQRSELKIDIRSSKAQVAIKRAGRAYISFVTEFRKELDFKCPERIEIVYDKARTRGLFELAKQTREFFFGNAIYFYGVCYLWDSCIEKCTYCPASLTNRAGTYKARKMSVEEAVSDVKAIMEDGHTNICFLTGKDPVGHPASRLAEYLMAMDELGLDEIILNIDPKTTKDFKTLRASVMRTSLQFRVFQETYNRVAYDAVHPVSKGMKWDYDFRRESQSRAIEAGFDNVGIGALLGLHRFPIDEINGLRQHSLELEQMGRLPARVCLPSANFMERIGVSIPYFLERGVYRDDCSLVSMGPYEWSSEILYALAKLAMPCISLVSSERDPKGLLQRLDSYASCTTLNVHPGVGGNLAHHLCEEDDEVHFEQAISFSRKPEATLKEMRMRGYSPVLKGMDFAGEG